MAEHDNDAYVRAVHDRGPRFDLRTMTRRRMLAAVGGAGALALAGPAGTGRRVGGPPALRAAAPSGVARSAGG
jgi:hypothetical protein